MRAPIHILMILTAAAVTTAQTPLKVGRLSFGSPRTVAELDMGKLKGQPSRLAWAPDGTELYIQTIEGAFPEPKAVHHYTVNATGGVPTAAPAEPEWVSPYWTLKSQQASPDLPEHKIALESQESRQQTTNVPLGGDLARGGTSVATGTSSTDATAAAYNSQMVMVHTMKLSGEIIGQFVNSVIVPGLTFGWGPKGSQAIAYAAHKSGKVIVMDAEGKRQELDGTKDALLPAWSPDGSRLAWLQKDGRRKFVLKVTEVQ